MRILYLPNAYSQQRQREKKANIYPIRMAMEAEYYKKQGHFVIWNNNDYPNLKQFYDKIIYEPEGIPFLELPHADRGFTRFWEYQDNGNFKHLPGTYILSASGCWHGKCTFCVEQNQKWEVREVNDVISEIEECKQLGIREVFDDSATFPVDDWLYSFCERIKKLQIVFSCNMRMVDLDYQLLRRSGFRMLLFGLESANQRTLDKIGKGVRVEDVKYIIKAARCGLEPHVAVMFGYPWETDVEVINTLRMVHYLLRKGYAKTAQASFYCPKDAQGNEDHRKYVRRIYGVATSPVFWFNKIKEVRSLDDIRYLWKQIKVGISGIW